MTKFVPIILFHQMMVVDLRSDTVTKPTKAMLDAMMSAEVGDDVFGEDPTVLALEKYAADFFGMEAGLFCPSGTFTNQTAIKILTKPYDELICYHGAHIYKYEGGGIAGNSLCSVRLLSGNRGRLTADDITQNINADDVHQARTSLVALENTVLREGGCYYTLPQIEAVYNVAKKNKIALHVDGARLCNALVETNENPKDYGKYFDTMSICLSKGLGAPVGSVLLMKKEYEATARRVRKVMGGGMRQAGYLAAAGLYALKNNVARLKDDHRRAKQIEAMLQTLTWVSSVLPVETNIIIFSVDERLDVQQLIQHWKNEFNVLALPFGKHQIRFVTHLDFGDAQLDYLLSTLKNWSPKFHAHG